MKKVIIGLIALSSVSAFAENLSISYKNLPQASILITTEGTDYEVRKDASELIKRHTEIKTEALSKLEMHVKNNLKKSVIESSCSKHKGFQTRWIEKEGRYSQGLESSCYVTFL